MADICERRVVRRSERDASHCLAAFIGQRRNRDGTVHIALRLPFRMFATRKSPIQRRVIATFYPIHSLGDEHSTYSVSWSAEGGGPFPEFAGALAVENLPRDDCFGLILSGHYEPPMGKIGAMFDAILGNRIAHGSTQELLRSIAAHVENASAPAISMFSYTENTPRKGRASDASQSPHDCTELGLPVITASSETRTNLMAQHHLFEIAQLQRGATGEPHTPQLPPKRQSRPLDHGSRISLCNATFAASDGCLTSQANRQSIASLNPSTTSLCETFL
jgi:hypothetical protein